MRLAQPAAILLLILSFTAGMGRAQLKVIYNDNFTNNKTNWPESNTQNYKSAVAEGHYTFSIYNNGSRWAYDYPQVDPGKYFIIEIKVKVKPGTIDGNSTAGIIWDADDKNYNIFYWRKDGTIGYEQTVNDAVAASESENCGIPITTDVYHILKVKSFSNRTEFYIDDKLVKKTAKLPYKRGRGIGMYAENPGVIMFDHLKVYQEREPINLAQTDFSITNKRNLGHAVNTAYHEVQPVISHDGKTLYFTRKDYPQNTGSVRDDIWYSERDASNTFTTSKNLGRPVNNSDYNAVAGFSADNKKMLVFGRYTPDGEYLGEGFCEFTKTPNGWGQPRNLDIKNFYNLNQYCESSYSPDGNVLILAIERRDTYGGKDIYISLRQPDGSWSAPFNAGPALNTFTDEISPFLAGDNKTLYFASSGHPGYGQADVFMTRRLDDTWKNWSKPVNMGPNVNSAEWDAYFTIDARGESAYMVSNHQSVGKTDIFWFHVPVELKPDSVASEHLLAKVTRQEHTLVKADSTYHKDTTAIINHTETVLKNTDTIREQHLTHTAYKTRVYGKVYDATTKKVLPAMVVVKEVEHNTELHTLAGDMNGYNITLEEGNNYGLYANYTGYIAEQVNVDLTNATGNMEKQADIYLKKMEKDQTVVMNNIFFEESSSRLRYDSRGELTNVAALMQENPTLVIEIGGHTSMNYAEPKLNRKLSEDRAREVYQELVKMGVDKKRMKYKGYGYDKPLYDVNSLWENAKNRRVDFTIVKL